MTVADAVETFSSVETDVGPWPNIPERFHTYNTQYLLITLEDSNTIRIMYRNYSISEMQYFYF